MDEPIEPLNQIQPNRVQFEPIIWQAEEFETHRRGWAWYLTTILVIVVLVAYTVYTRQWLLAGVVGAAGLVLYLSNRMRPRMMEYRIDPSGLSIGNRIFTFDQLKSFWFYTRESQVYLNLVSVMRLMPVITIKLTSVDQGKIREILGKFIPEVANQGEDWVDKINRFLKV